MPIVQTILQVVRVKMLSLLGSLSPRMNQSAKSAQHYYLAYAAASYELQCGINSFSNDVLSWLQSNESKAWVFWMLMWLKVAPGQLNSVV